MSRNAIRKTFAISAPNTSPGWALKPWAVEDPFIAQAVAETLDSLRDEAEIIGVVKRSIVPELLRNPAYSPNNFSGYLAGELARFGGGPVTVPHDWNLPGKGEPKRECGRYIRAKTFGCPEGHEIHAVPHSCHRMDCPVCFPDAVARMAKRIEEHLRVVADLGAGLAEFHHVVVSPPPEWAKEVAPDLDGFKELKGATWDVLRECGALGACLIFHPYRQDDGAETWRKGPHFHAIVYGHGDSSRRVPGWILKDLGAVPLDRLNPLAYYLVSHAGVSHGRVYRPGNSPRVNTIPAYFGVCSTAGKLAPVKVAEYLREAPRACACCGGNLFNYFDWLKAGPVGRPCLAPVTERHAWRVWVARKDKDRARAILDGLGESEALAVAYDAQWMSVIHDFGPPRFDPSEVDAVGVRG
jgi:hypothetical protein